ncbi:MAG: cupin domain-containing protein [Bacteroidetes bacterium]|nr:cupin domain-containing protein [Bacteroidota bacterium]
MISFSRLSEKPNYYAPDNSEIRLLSSVDAGGLCHCTLPPDSISKAVKHKTVEEIWFCIAGKGTIWQKNDAFEEEQEFTAGDSFIIQVGNCFQFRNDGEVPLRILIQTMPKWPGNEEAIEVKGKWDSSTRKLPKSNLKQFIGDLLNIGKQVLGSLIVLLFVAFFLFMLPKNAAEFLFESHSSLILRIIWFVVIIPLTCACVWLITSEKAIKDGWLNVNIPSFLLGVFSLYAIAGVFFSTVIFILYTNGIVTVTPDDGIHKVTISGLLDLFLWQLFEAIPALKINELLQFKKPFIFDGWVGFTVLLFQLSVIFPIIKFYKKIKEFKKSK